MALCLEARHSSDITIDVTPLIIYSSLRPDRPQITPPGNASLEGRSCPLFLCNLASWEAGKI